jgi:hypothetical protein
MIAALKKAEKEEEQDTLSDKLWTHYFYLNFELNSMRTLSSYFTFQRLNPLVVVSVNFY